MRYYLDSNVFIYPALFRGKKSTKCRKLLEKIVRGEDTGITSALAIDEVVWSIMKRKGRQKALLEARRIFELPNLRVLGVTAEDAYVSLRFMEKYPGLNPRDAIHLTVALNAGVYTIYSDDRHFDTIEEVNRKKL